MITSLPTVVHMVPPRATGMATTPSPDGKATALGDRRKGSRAGYFMQVVFLAEEHVRGMFPPTIQSPSSSPRLLSWWGSHSGNRRRRYFAHLDRPIARPTICHLLYGLRRGAP